MVFLTCKREACVISSKIIDSLIHKHQEFHSQFEKHILEVPVYGVFWIILYM